MTLITAELSANAVRHGRVRGRDFHVRLTAEADVERLHVEVVDARAKRRPAGTAPTGRTPSPSPAAATSSSSCVTNGRTGHDGPVAVSGYLTWKP
ncbi:ATP-binding protein [Streptomyces albogriseolus]|uniref:hypothetical protein n=1 Tax=Streptomyces albogriseolus TaxID=1887 RepID=UPI0038506577